jgi:hypothetical protein
MAAIQKKTLKTRMSICQLQTDEALFQTFDSARDGRWLKKVVEVSRLLRSYLEEEGDNVRKPSRAPFLNSEERIGLFLCR